MERTKKKKQSIMKHWLMITLFSVLMLYVILTILPIAWAIISSFKSENDFLDKVMSFPTEMPGKHIFSNYVEAYHKLTYKTPYGGEDVNVWGQLWNSILYVGGCVIVQTFTPCVVAYVVARYKYKFLNILYVINIVTMALPIIGSLPSEVRMVKFFGFDQQIWGMWIMKMHFLGLNFLIFHAQFTTIPKDYTEAAKMDGASNFRVMTQIIMPLAWGTISTVMLLAFISFWNEYQTPWLYLQDKPVLAVGLYDFYQSFRVTNGAVKIAGMVLLTIPILLVFIIFQNKLMTNLSIGGIKG